MAVAHHARETASLLAESEVPTIARDINPPERPPAEAHWGFLRYPEAGGVSRWLGSVVRSGTASQDHDLREETGHIRPAKNAEGASEARASGGPSGCRGSGPLMGIARETSDACMWKDSWL